MNKLKKSLGIFFALAILAVPATLAAQNEVNKVILASNVNYPDAIVSSAVSQKLGIPVLLTEKGSIPEETLSALQEFNPDEIIVVGGPAVISENQVRGLRDRGYTVTWLWGMSRYGTAEEVAGHFWPEGADRALLVENNLGEPNGNVMAAAKNLANGTPVLPVPEGEIPAGVLNQFREMDTKKVTIVGTKVTDEMESNLSALGIQIQERIQAQNEERLQERIQNRSMEDMGKNDTLVVVAAGNFRHTISAPNLPQAQSFLVSSEDEIQDAVDAVNERDIQNVKVVGKPTLAQQIADALNETDAEIDLVSEGAQNAVAQAAKVAKQNRSEFAQRFQKRNQNWQQKIQAAQQKMRKNANQTMEKIRNLAQDYDSSQAQEMLDEANQSFQQGNYQKALEKAREARRQIRNQKWQRVRNNWTAVRQQVQQEVQSLRQRTQELSQMNRQFGQRMTQNMTVEERLQVIEQFHERRMSKVRQIVKTAAGMGPMGKPGKWLRKAEKQAKRGRQQTNQTQGGQQPPAAPGI